MCAGGRWVGARARARTHCFFLLLLRWLVFVLLLGVGRRSSSLLGGLLFPLSSVGWCSLVSFFYGWSCCFSGCPWLLPSLFLRWVVFRSSSLFAWCCLVSSYVWCCCFCFSSLVALSPFASDGWVVLLGFFLLLVVLLFFLLLFGGAAFHPLHWVGLLFPPSSGLFLLWVELMFSPLLFVYHTRTRTHPNLQIQNLKICKVKFFRKLKKWKNLKIFQNQKHGKNGEKLKNAKDIRKKKSKI